MTTATQKGREIWQKTRRMLGRGYQLFTIQEIKLAQALQRKFALGYPLVRIVAFFVKLVLALALLFIVGWLIVGILAVVAFFVADTKNNEKEPVYGTDRYETKYPGQ